MARRSTITLPLINKPAPPSAQAWYRRISASDGACPASAMFSSIAALAKRLGISLPLGSVSLSNTFMGATSIDRVQTITLKLTLMSTGVFSWQRRVPEALPPALVH
ncbi:hypothetical protein D3C81_2088120 [compost metagenome]